MDDENRAGAGRAVEREAEEIDRHEGDADNPGGTGPEAGRHIAQNDPRRAGQDEDGDAREDEDGEDEEADDEDEGGEDDADTEEDEDDERGTTPV